MSKTSIRVGLYGLAGCVVSAAVLVSTDAAPLRPTDQRAEGMAIKFTAVDGREVDLSVMKGKVVLIDFWATWCGPCVAEIPHVRRVYEQYHDEGFEIIGISLDHRKEVLVEFVEDENLPWPQYFDGKGWDNELAARFNIESIPTMWLVDKEGRLADTNARSGLEKKVKKLLSE